MRQQRGGAQWEPKSFVELCHGGERSAALDRLGAASALVVRLEERGDELEAGLFSSSPLAHAAARTPASAMAFQTQTGDAGALQVARVAAREVRREDPAGQDRIPVDLLAHACFVVPLRKKIGGPGVLLDRITVGRARNHDIVLRHHTISKFHAYLEENPKGEVLIRDAGSKNHTFVNGTQVGQEPVTLEAGARVRFGSVEALFCSAETLVAMLSR